MTLIVNIAGVKKIGTTYVCHTVKKALENKGKKVEIVNLENNKQLVRFEDSYYMNAYSKVDVVLIDKHPKVTQAVKRNLSKPNFNDSNIKLDMTFLLTCNENKYKNIIGEIAESNELIQLLHRHEVLKREFYNTHKLYDCDTTGEHGSLSASGYIVNIILSKLD